MHLQPRRGLLLHQQILEDGLSIGGLQIKIQHRSQALRRWISSLEPFRWRALQSPHLGLELLGEVPAEEHCYQRADLRFSINAARDQAYARVQETPGGFCAALELSLQAALLPRGGLLIHGAAGVLRGEGWLLAGPSGAGKSTAALQAGFDRVLSDEMLILRRSGAGFKLWGTPFWSRGRSLALDPGPVPLRRIVRLGKSPQLFGRVLRPDEGAAHLLSCVTLYEWGSEARQRAFELTCEAALTAPAWELAVPKEGPWLQDCPP